MTDDAASAKRRLRATARAARVAVPAPAREEAAREAARRAMTLTEVASARAVLAYAALAEELDPAPLVDALRASGARVALPRVCGPGALTLHWVEADTPLAPGHAGIPEPDAGCAFGAPDDFDLVIVPGVAFDASCARLGFGGGFYDALLGDLPSETPTVALAFDEQIVDSVPCGEHDVRVSAVVTPTRVLRRATGAGRE